MLYSKTYYFDRNLQILIISKVATCNQTTQSAFKNMDYLSIYWVFFEDPVLDRP